MSVEAAVARALGALGVRDVEHHNHYYYVSADPPISRSHHRREQGCGARWWRYLRSRRFQTDTATFAVLVLLALTLAERLVVLRDYDAQRAAEAEAEPPVASSIAPPSPPYSAPPSAR